MVAKQRAVDRGAERGRLVLRSVGAEIRLARARSGLSIEFVARAVGISGAEVSRIERAKADWASVITLAKLCAVVGLDLSARAFPGGGPLRDARHGRLLNKLRRLLHTSLGWALEVPLPNPGDQRAWDALIRGDGWCYGVECEMNPLDGQAALRRLALKQKEGMVDGVILLLPDTRKSRLFRREFADVLVAQLPVRGSAAVARLSGALDPGGSAVVVL